MLLNIKNKGFTILVLCCMACTTPIKNSGRISGNISGNSPTCNNLPNITLEKNKFTKVKEPFTHSVGGEKVQERTNIWMKYNDSYLEIKFECLDNQRVNQNFYTEDNSPLFFQEVLELFICNGEQPLEDYLEIQINPNNAIYLAAINYRYKSDKAYDNRKLDTKTSGIEHNVIKDKENNKWSGFIRLPLQLINYPEKSSDNTYRLNLFRIISNNDQTDPNWMCTPENSTFACWNSTMETKPQFHKPECFGYLFLK